MFGLCVALGQNTRPHSRDLGILHSRDRAEIQILKAYMINVVVFVHGLEASEGS